MKANLLIGLNDLEGAQQWYAKSSRRHKDNLEVRLAEARFLVKNNEPELALEKLQSIIKDW